ncbi:arsenate reductase ArsC [Pseudovibrio exalbescens]|uniref:arsenate reductase ArsC n=1 Tax=Pseudovibrio exalbescens TaxID=197461 RepID=UPI00236574B3|nr:arsenate reductase ArsC [Pseudovibrio exalbescens]MDD7911240.1 arsenate reductase ArsC [Pseudovibrio exalbescens]
MSHPEYNVLFLCTGNAARSLMAEVILNTGGRGWFHAFSAGSHPMEHAHPMAIELLDKLDLPTGGLRPKSWDEFAKPDAPKMDFVFTVCDAAAGETCPIWPGAPMSIHWGVPDPKIVEGTEAEKRLAFSEAYRMLNNRISLFLSLPIASLDEMTLRNQLQEIGETQ